MLSPWRKSGSNAFIHSSCCLYGHLSGAFFFKVSRYSFPQTAQVTLQFQDICIYKFCGFKFLYIQYIQYIFHYFSWKFNLCKRVCPKLILPRFHLLLNWYKSVLVQWRILILSYIDLFSKFSINPLGFKLFIRHIIVSCPPSNVLIRYKVYSYFWVIIYGMVVYVIMVHYGIVLLGSYWIFIPSTSII